MTIELTQVQTRPRLINISKVLLCGYGRQPDMLDFELCPETLVVLSDGDAQHLPEGMHETARAQLDPTKVEYGRCREHGRVAVHNAIPPVVPNGLRSAR